MDLRQPRPAGERVATLSMARPLGLVGIALALLFALALSLMPAPSAHAAASSQAPQAAPAYPFPKAPCTCHVSSQQVKSGQLIKFVGKSSESLKWVVRFNGKTKTSVGKEFRTSFVAPEVSGRKNADGVTYRLSVEAAYADPAKAAAEPCRESFEITVSPRSGQGGPSAGNNDGALPNTGGPQLALLGVALLLLLLGVASIRRARGGNEA